ncbi:MAG: class I SAM-dependent methyltransferase [Phycisphaerales bacterium]|jgi:SAM-dependent methyltransferase
MSTSTAARATDYRAIYDHVVTNNANYTNPSGSPGCNACWLESARIRAAGGPALDVGCGVGFAVELLRGPHFQVAAVGVDISPASVEIGNARMGANLLTAMPMGRIPFPDNHFALVTCFDMLEHLDERDLGPIRDEMRRVLRPGGLMYCSIATRLAYGLDQFGDNLHRTVKPPDWWANLFDADETKWMRRNQDLYVFWHKPLG